MLNIGQPKMDGDSMSTAPDTPASIPEHLLETITDGLDFRDDQGWIPWVWLRSLGGGVFAALRGGLVAAITQDWLQVGVAV